MLNLKMIHFTKILSCNANLQQVTEHAQKQYTCGSHKDQGNNHGY